MSDSNDNYDEILTWEDFTIPFNVLQLHLHKYSVEKGFWPEPVNMGEKIALVHAEASEALEAIREGSPPFNEYQHGVDRGEQLTFGDLND